MKDLILIGGGGHCRSCIDVIEQQRKFRVIGILDNHLASGTNVLDCKVIGNDGDIENFAERQINEKIYFLVTIGQTKTAESRMIIFNRLKESSAKMAVIISPLAYVSKYASVEEGTIVMHHALVNTNARIGKNCIINSKALVEHDAIVADHCHISTAAIINGGVKIGESSFVGSNSIIVNNVDVTSFSFIRAGEVVK
ncbi:MAG: NeuD/PglB/VioB family sugar acetyltransferase [Holosporaceae bacterium]|jgi:sugar O-acyltransferase (sialic acid O-acetyltransferase NeuD family)|nr:NeuD/PglB/VioB family sugar acetyltransferase [Holosporaceae bacterium]